MSFLGNPRQFLEQHVVRVSETIPDPGTAGVRRFNIAPLMPGSATYVITQGDGDGDGEPFSAFWVPYLAGHYSECDVGAIGDAGADVRFILTFTLSGCTFVAGAGRQPKLAHINYQAGDQIDQASIDRDVDANFRGGAAMVLKKDGYFGRSTGLANNKFTVIGVLDGAEWAFFLNCNGQFANGLKAWELHGMVDIPDAAAAGGGGAGHGRQRGCCTLF